MKRKNESQLASEVRRQVEAKYEERNGLIGHLVAYLIVNLMVWATYLLGAGGFPWPLFVTGGWGIGFISHALSYYNEHGAGAEKREAAIAAEVERKYRLARMREELNQQDLYAADDEAAVVYGLEHYEPRHLRLSDDGELVELDDVEADDLESRSARP